MAESNRTQPWVVTAMQVAVMASFVVMACVLGSQYVNVPQFVCEGPAGILWWNLAAVAITVGAAVATLPLIGKEILALIGKVIAGTMFSIAVFLVGLSVFGRTTDRDTVSRLLDAIVNAILFVLPLDATLSSPPPVCPPCRFF